MVTRTSLNVTLHVHWFSCIKRVSAALMVYARLPFPRPVFAITIPVPGYHATPAHHSNQYVKSWCVYSVPPSGEFIQISNHRLAKAHFHYSSLQRDPNLRSQKPSDRRTILQNALPLGLVFFRVTSTRKRPVIQRC